MNGNDAAHPGSPVPRPRRLPEVSFGVILVMVVAGWLMRDQTGPLYALSVAFSIGGLILWAAPSINKVPNAGQLLWPKRALARWRSIPTAIRAITISTASFFIALGLFLWAIGVRIDTDQVINANPWIPGVALAVYVVGCLAAVMALGKWAAARRAADKRNS